MADIQAIEVLLEQLGIPLPTRAAQTRATLDKLSVLDVPLRPTPSTQGLADIIRGQVSRGEDCDPVALAREAREGADNVEADRAVQLATEDAVHLHELSFRGGGGLIPPVKAAIEEVYVKVRALPANTPTSALGAVHADEKARQAFVTLEELAVRHSQLRRLHKLLIADDVAQEVALILFGDTELMPPAWPSRIQPVQAAGPVDALARVRWLATPAAKAWAPTATEINARYLAALQALSNPVTAASAANKEE